jgi:hypothetical protein
MLDDPQKDPMGSLILEARADSDVDNLVDGRVRGFEPADGDAKGPGEYQAFVVLSALAVPIHPQLPITDATYGIAAYGSTPQNAWAVWAALVKAWHARGPRVGSSHLGIYRSWMSGGEQDKDPDTQQPLVRGTLRLIATAQALA